MKCREVAIPSDSLTRRFLPADYSDAFACTAPGAADLSADDILTALWTSMPAWVVALFRLRNALVRLFGLKGGGMKEFTERFESLIRSGGSMDMVSVEAKSANETVIRLSDRHLDALMSVHTVPVRDASTVTAITLVHYHNRLGRFYFFFVRPFHGPVVKSMLKFSMRKNIQMPR